MSINILNKESALIRSVINTISFTTAIFVWDIPLRSPHYNILTYYKVTYLTALSTVFFDLGVFAWQNNSTSYFCVSLKWGAFYITVQWGGFRIKTLVYVFIHFFDILLLFFIIKRVFIIFISSWWSIKFPEQNIRTNQKQDFVIQNCQWNCLPQHFLNWHITLRLLHRFNFTW